MGRKWQNEGRSNFCTLLVAATDNGSLLSHVSRVKCFAWFAVKKGLGIRAAMDLAPYLRPMYHKVSMVRASVDVSRDCRGQHSWYRKLGSDVLLQLNSKGVGGVEHPLSHSTERSPAVVRRNSDVVQ
jgi:hypothetical protein